MLRHCRFTLWCSFSCGRCHRCRRVCASGAMRATHRVVLCRWLYQWHHRRLCRRRRRRCRWRVCGRRPSWVVKKRRICMRAFAVRRHACEDGELVCVIVVCSSRLCVSLLVAVVRAAAGALRDFVDPELVVSVAAPAADAFVHQPGHLLSRGDDDLIACKHTSERVTLRLDGFPPWLLRAAEFGYRVESVVCMIVWCW